MVDDDFGILGKSLDHARDETLGLDDLSLELRVAGGEEGEDEHAEKGADVGPEEGIARGVLQASAEETSDDLQRAEKVVSSSPKLALLLLTHLGLPLHASKEPPSKTSLSEAYHHVAELQRGDGDIVTARVESTVEVTAVLREETADNLGLVGERVGGHQANESSEGCEDGGRELRVVGLAKKQRGISL